MLVNSLHHIFYVSDFYVYEVGKRLFSEYNNICISINNHKLACQKLKLKIQLRKNFQRVFFVSLKNLILVRPMRIKFGKSGDNLTFVNFLLFKVLLKGLIWEIDWNKLLSRRDK